MEKNTEWFSVKERSNFSRTNFRRELRRNTIKNSIHSYLIKFDKRSIYQSIFLFAVCVWFSVKCFIPKNRLKVSSGNWNSLLYDLTSTVSFWRRNMSWASFRQSWRWFRKQALIMQLWFLLELSFCGMDKFGNITLRSTFLVCVWSNKLMISSYVSDQPKTPKILLV